MSTASHPARGPVPTFAGQPAETRPRRVLVSLVALAAVVAALWQFPNFWYQDTQPGGGYHWFAEQNSLPGWTYQEVPLSAAAEAVIQADAVASGVFRARDRGDVQVYSAKRYLKKENEIGLFSHTPDRCWTAVGWTIEPAAPDSLELDVHGVRLLLERRVFVHGSQRVLVYFGAVVGGKPLPYRLDQYHSAATTPSGSSAQVNSTWRRLAQWRLWEWAWDSFRQRTPLAGPQQFLRLSTSASGDLQEADQRLREFLPQWLRPADYGEELKSWQARPPAPRKST